MDESIAHSTYKKGLKHSSVLAVCFGFRGILSLLPHILIAKRLGLGNFTDAYLMAISIQQIIMKLIRLGTLPKIFIMALSGNFVKSRKKTEDNVNNILNILVIVSCLIMAAVYFSAPLLVKIIAAGFGADKQLLTAQILLVLVPLFFYQALVSLFESIFKLSNEFSRWAMLSLISPIVTVCFVYFYVVQLGIYSIVYGILFGAFIHLLLLIYYVYFKFNYRYRFRLNFRDQLVKEIPVLLYPYYLSSILVQLRYGVQNFLVSLLAPGVSSSYFLVIKMKKYVEEFFIDSFSQITFPYFIKKIAATSIERLKNVYGQLLRIANYVFFPILILSAVNGIQLTDILFGNRFTDVGIITNMGIAFSCFMIFLLPEASNNMQFNVILSMKETMRVNVVNILRMAIVIILSIALFKQFRFWGIIFSYSLTNLQGFLMNHWYLRKRYNFENILLNPHFLKIIFLNLFLLLFSIYVHYLTQRLFSFAYLYQRITVVCINFSLGILFYGFISYLFKAKELNLMLGLLRKR